MNGVANRDVLYVLRDDGRSTVKQDLLMKISLRSLERHGKGVGKVMIATNKRRVWMSRENIELLEVYEEAKNPHRNAYAHVCRKLESACQRKKQFWLLNDDFIFLDEWRTNDLTYYCLKRFGDLFKPDSACGSIGYRDVMERTQKIFKISNDEVSFLTHTPFWVGTPHIPANFHIIRGGGEMNKSYSFRQAYGVHARVQHYDFYRIKILSQDVKFRQSVDNENDFERMKSIRGSVPMVSLSPYSTTDFLIDRLLKMYPNKSKYEV
jgi:hypothetical protein